MKERLIAKGSKPLMGIFLLTVLLCMTFISASASPIDASVFNANEISVVQTDIKILDGAWTAGSTEEAFAAVESLTDHEVHLCILQKEETGCYTVVSMSSGILSLDDYNSNPHQLLDHLNDGHPYFDITTDEQWLYIEVTKNEEEWFISSFLVEDSASGDRVTCDCNLDTQSAWVYAIAYPRINWPFLKEEMMLDHFDIASFTSRCERALSYLEEWKGKEHYLQVLEIEW
ncbi:MAG: hypothetical protein Q4B32_03650 [Clostridia bacterium]|nr:hypothetical protein [Clostridia bacterium]